MKLWLLRPVGHADEDDGFVRHYGRGEGDDPWEPWYDKAFGFVVRAEDEASARKLAHGEAGDENRGEFLSKPTAKTNAPWLDSAYSTCEELTSDGPEGVVIRDFASA